MQNTFNQIKLSPKNVLVICVTLTILMHLFSLFHKIDFSTPIVSKIQEDEQKVIIKLINARNNVKTRQIVETKQKNLQRKTKDSKFVSDKNRAVDRETVAASVGKFQEAAKGVRFGDKVKRVNQKAKSGNKKKKVSLADLAVDRGKLLEKMFKQNQTARPKLGLKTGRGKKAGLSRRSDYIEDLPLGDFTKLNTVEYKYYGFFFRIKQKLEQFWGSSIQTVARKMFKQGRRIPANKHYITSLIISMDNNGKILKVDVDSTSGVRELDGAAIGAFNKAGPFPNPPKGLIKNGIATIRWKFAVDAN
jgi:TonB family protein